MPPPLDRCERVKWHSAQKHALIEAYLRIWTQNVGARKPETAPTLSIVDLNAGLGWCYNDESKGDPWPGTAISAARHLATYDCGWKPKGLFLNSYHPEGGVDQQKQLEALVGNIHDEFPEGTLPFAFDGCALPATEAVERAKASRAVDRRFPSLWLLDPYTTDQLPWSVVQSIIDFDHTYEQRGKTVHRRPEMFINLMTHMVQRNIDKTPEVLSVALGQPVEEWWPKYEALRTRMNTLDAVVTLYSDRLGAFYKYPPVTIRVPSTRGNIVYVMTFVTNNPAGYHMFLQQGLPAFEVWLDNEWRPVAEDIEQKKAVAREDDALAKRGLKQMRFDDSGGF